MSKTNTVGQNMLLYSSVWGPHKTFKLIPVTENCPYAEGIFDPASKVLVIISRTTKETFHMMPKLDENGDPARLKLQRRDNGKDFKEERRALETFLEYYISEKEEVKRMVELFAVNAKDFEIDSYLNAVIEQPKAPGSIIQPGIS